MAAHRVAFCHLPQLLTHAAVFLCVLAVLSRVLPVFILTTFVLFGGFFVCLRCSVVTICGCDQAVGCTSLGCLRCSPRLLRSLTARNASSASDWGPSHSASAGLSLSDIDVPLVDRRIGSKGCP